ncbi:hypothetical protein PIB30_091329, partial [Stylosanthes scabra]|nr:hypothetical protein [Stylosanthes scabra]
MLKKIRDEELIETKFSWGRDSLHEQTEMGMEIEKERKTLPKPSSDPHPRHPDSRRRHRPSPPLTFASPLSFSIPYHTTHLRSASPTAYLNPSFTNTDHNSSSSPLTDTHCRRLPRHQPIGHHNRSERKTLASPPLLRTRFCSNPSLQKRLPTISSRCSVAIAARHLQFSRLQVVEKTPWLQNPSPQVVCSMIEFGLAGTQRLPRLVGLTKPLEMMLVSKLEIDLHNNNQLLRAK